MSKHVNRLQYNANKPVTLTNCDKEPIHIIGQVQPHGFLLVVDTNYVVTQTTTNVSNFILYSVEEVVGKEVYQFFPNFEGTFDNLIEFGAKEIYQYKEMTCDCRKKDGTMQPLRLCVHLNIDGLMIIEAEEVGSADFISYGERISNLFKIFSEQEDLYSVLDMCATEIKEVGGYSRVMIYEFDPDYNGRVIVSTNSTFPLTFLRSRKQIWSQDS